MPKIYGQLEKAQFENIAASTTTPTPTGRYYCDVTNPLAAVPMFYNGSAWRTLQLAQNSPFVQNSGTACTVDWSKGLLQQVVLTGHCLISFSNPQPGQQHTLLVTQRETFPTASNIMPYQYKFNMLDQATKRGPYQPQSVLQSAETTIWSWLYQPGIKAGYANVPTQLASTGLSTATPSCIDIHPKVPSFIYNQTASGFIQGRYYADTGFKLSVINSMGALPTLNFAAGACYDMEYTQDGQLALFCGSTSPYVDMHPTDQNGQPINISYSNPGTLPTGIRYCLSVHPTGSAVAVSGATSPFCEIYTFSTAGWGTKWANPVSLPNSASSSAACAFSPMGDYIAVTINTNAPFIEMWPIDLNTGWGTKCATLTPGLANGPGAGVGKGLAWRPQGDMLAVITQGTAPYVQVVGFNRATGTWGTTTAPNASGAPAAACMGLAWSPCGNYLAIVSQTTPFLFVYDMSAGLGFPASAPLTLDGGAPAAANAIKFTPNGEHMVLALNSSPYLMVMPAPRKTKNYLRISE